MATPRPLAGLALALALPLAAGAADISWDYVDVRYTGADSAGLSGDGFGVTGLKSIGSSAYLLGGYDTIAFDTILGDIDYTFWRVGIGTHRGFSETVHGFSEFTYEEASVDTPFGSVGDNGFGFRLGLRADVAEKLELNGGIRYIDVGSTDTLLGVGAVLALGERFGLTASYEDGDDAIWAVGARITF